MQVSLTSLGFLLFAVVAVLAVGILRGAWREGVFLFLNVAFLLNLLLGPVGTASTLGFTLMGYALVRLVHRYGVRGLAIGVGLSTVVFIYLRRYDFLAAVLPDSLLARGLATIGLSFLFFKLVHLLVDAHAGTLGRLPLVGYFNYMLNFSTFMMGPIQRFQDYREQWTGQRDAIPPDFESHLDAGIRFLVGLVKACVLAPVVLKLSLQPDTELATLSLPGLLLQAYAFWIYLYLNFSGYCDAVIALGSMFGVRPPENFNRPYLARNISDFWLRQHRSLTLWLTDYVFTPTCKRLLQRPGLGRFTAVSLSLMLTMMVSGLWHGTTLSFFLFGLAHGLFFVIYHAWDTLLLRRFGRAAVNRFRARPVARAGGMFLTFNATALAFVFFQVRTERITEALRAWLG